MERRERALTREEARRFYDDFGARQDAQAVYEDPPNHDLGAHLQLGSGRDVFEFGCGTGRLAEHLLTHGLPEHARYRAVDLSQTMVDLARKRLERFGPRASAERTDGSMVLAAPDASFDRFVSTYVLDLLARADIEALVAQIHRVLRPGGLAGVSGLAHGSGLAGRSVTWLWKTVHRLSPSRVGGCRPLELGPLFPSAHWDVCHASQHSWRGLTSAVLVARRR